MKARAVEGGAKLEWEPPAEEPEEPITRYEYQKQGDADWTPTEGTETEADVKNLVNGKSYKFRTRAVNSKGKGPASAPTSPVTPLATGLTATFVSVPSSHDGSTSFTLRVEFSEAVGTSASTMRDHAFEVTGGSVTGAQGVDGRRDLWELTVEPSTNGAVTVELPADRACDDVGAVCTVSDEPLVQGAEATVPGPQAVVSVAAPTGPLTEGESASFTLSRTGDTAAALTVAVAVTEDGAVLAGAAPSEAVFAAGSSTATLAVATEDDEIAGDTSVVTVRVEAGTGYAVDSGGVRGGGHGGRRRRGPGHRQHRPVPGERERDGGRDAHGDGRRHAGSRTWNGRWWAERMRTSSP